MSAITVKEYCQVNIQENVIWVKHPSIVDKEVGEKLFREIREAFNKKIDKNKKIMFCYDCTEVKVGLIKSESDMNGFKQTIIEFHNSINDLNTDISLIIANTLVRVIAGAINVVVRKKSNFFKTEEEAKTYIRTLVPGYK